MRYTFILLTSLLSFASASYAVAADDAATDSGQEKGITISVFGDGTLAVPAEFKKGQSASRIVEHELVASFGEGDDAKTARVYSMQSGGGVVPNIDRWKGQFTESPAGAFKREDLTVGKWKVYLIDHAGSFSERMGGGPFAGGRVVKRENHAMVGAIIAHPDDRLYFVKMIGPAEVVKENREAFVKMIKSIGE